MLGQNDRVPAASEALRVTFQKCLAGCFQFDRQFLRILYEFHARREANQVVGVGQRRGLIKVIDAPAAATFRISPGSKTSDVQVSRGKHLRSVREFRAYFWPHLNPLIKSSA